MNWKDEFATTPLSQRPLSELSFFLQPYVSDCLETHGQLAHNSDLFSIDESGDFEREESRSELDQCPYLTPYLFEIRVAGNLEDTWMSERIGTVYGYFIEAGYLLEDIESEGSAIFAYDGFSQLLSNVWCDMLELLNHPNPQDPLLQTLFHQWKDHNEHLHWSIDHTKSLFVLSSIELDDAFQRVEVVNLVLNGLLPNYFYKVREAFELAGILYTNGFIPFDDEFGGNRSMDYYQRIESFCIESGFTRLENKTMDYLFYRY